MMGGTQFRGRVGTSARDTGKLSIHVQHIFGQVLADPNQTLDETKDNQTSDADAKDVSDEQAAAVGVRVEEEVGVEAVDGVEEVGEGEVEGEPDDEPEHVDGTELGVGGAGQQHLEEGHGEVGGVLGVAGVGGEDGGEGAAGAEEEGPVDDGDDDGVDDDGGVEERVQGLQRARERGEQRAAGAGVGEGVQGGDGEVEAQAPECEDGEVGKGLDDLVAAAVLVAGAGPADDEEAASEDEDALLGGVWGVQSGIMKILHEKYRGGHVT